MQFNHIFSDSVGKKPSIFFDKMLQKQPLCQARFSCAREGILSPNQLVLGVVNTISLKTLCFWSFLPQIWQTVKLQIKTQVSTKEKLFRQVKLKTLD